ncbi:fumarylacetoacetate hydrolase family protein [Sideroxydans sp. CL21]|uniref:fumarylacetoacetate hydrolase family protein n=1 Tax=Sideroxydans sp. CL21 TaxID=2600596 RepID=UPI0024BBF177|nr:fumarylacetoacetate hydrolase family protein [Sideroxydans sp. CL21]
MITRRTFLTATTAVTAGVAMGITGQADAGQESHMKKFSGPHEMPKGLTLLSIANADGTETLGIKTASAVIDVRKASHLLGISAPMTMEELLREGNAAGLTKIAANSGNAKIKPALLDEANITHGRLFTNPGKIVCVGLNYKRHAKEIGMQEPRVPPLFNKFNNALAAHNCTIDLPPRDISYKFDYETEMLIVIGKSARNVPEADALNYVAGYCTANDFSARDLQLELPSSQWMIGKTLDKFAPIGPYFVSADLVGDPNNLKLETRVNGEVRQSWNTNDFIFNTQQMIAYISKHWTLEPGDIIFTGTPHGVILGYPKDKQVWLKAGDEIVSSIEKLGELKFKLA